MKLNANLYFLISSGLDDLSCSQCVSLLRRVAHGGRTVICSIHTPSAKIFEMFDHVYILSGGQCVYQGKGSQLVNYMYNIGLNCPLTYNPADFGKSFLPVTSIYTFNNLFHLSLSAFAAIDVASGEYGHEYVDKMITLVDNGRCDSWVPIDSIEYKNNRNNEKIPDSIEEFDEEINPKHLESRSSFWTQFCTLYRRRTIQMWRDSVSKAKRAIYRFNWKNKLIFFKNPAELHEITNLHDIVFGSCCRRNLSRHWE